MKKKIDWEYIFKIRCRSKSGKMVTEEEMILCHKAYKENPRKYELMEATVFNSTVPFGSEIKMEETVDWRTI